MDIDLIKEGLAWSDVDLVRNELQHIVPALDPELYPDRAGMRYYLDLSLPEFPLSAVFETMITLEGREKPPLISAGTQVYEGCAFRLEEILAGQLSITLPAKDLDKMTAVASLTTPYVIREKIEPGLWDKSQPIRYAMRAGIAFRDFAGYQHAFFSRYQAEKKQFLTWQPNNKQVSTAQKEFLYFLLNMSPFPDRIRLRMRVTKYDGSQQVLTISETEGFRPFQVICCPVGVSALDLGAYVSRYEIWLSDGANERFSEVRTFVIDRQARVFERFLVFSNSLGGFDTLRLLGQASHETDVVKTISRKERPAGKGLDFSELEVIGVSENSGIQVSTGFFERDAVTYSDYLRELMLAEVILMDTEHGFESLNLVTTNLEYAKDRPGLIERTFELERTYSDKNYSRMDAADPIPARPVKWVGVSAKAVLNAFGKRTGKLAWERLQKVYQDDDSKVIPYAVKPNIPGDPDYIPAMNEASIVPGSTPYPSVLISRPIDYKKNNCGANLLGTAPTVVIAAGTYGGELPGDGDSLAESKFETFNNQAYANENGACEVNNVPVHFALFHKIPMDGGTLKVVGSTKYGPVVDLRVNGSILISNTIGQPIPAIRTSDATTATGIKNLLFQVSFVQNPFSPCKLKIVGKNREITVTGPGFYVAENIQVNSSDEPLTIEINPL
ncbi:DUF5977 domain-containing protein [Dyadobacter sp. CY323]|uniref:DUF5977 domain-containing protein n=1 Tax=Dyadobacter sp. CY323 TaxID=2907302 RepID=UPI001F35D123|nr:DUF5977 domain-containing protein [Dyadobacter sp. CY323]MCE6987481.1 DUF5977 domain-containing protein [Dyadobacter sp. CY323]